jgi:hypothetical protein
VREVPMKNPKTRILAVLCILSLLALNVPYSQAACVNYGKIVYLYVVYVSATTAYAYIYVSPNVLLPTYYHYYYTNNASVIQAALTAAGSQIPVTIYGNAASCPTTGAYRYGGTITQILLYPSY